MIYSELRVETVNGYKFNLELRGHITLVGGDSASGKTFLVRAIKAKKFNTGIIGNSYESDIRNVIIYDFTTGINEKLLENLSGKLIIIDNADIIVSQTLADYIKADLKNQYLVFSRDSVDYHITPNYRATMMKDGNVFRLRYEYSKPGWF